MRFIAALVCFLLAAAAQSGPVLSSRDHLALLQRSMELMATGASGDGELAKQAAPIVAKGREVVEKFARSGQFPLTQTHRFLGSLNDYLALELVKSRPEAAELQAASLSLRSHLEGAMELAEVRLRGSDRDNLARYAEANVQLARAEASKRRVVFLGDSITDGWRLHEYFPSRDFINRGISGQITGEMLGRMKADVIDNKPALMVVLAGTNDIARGVPVSTIENNFSMIADLALAHGIRPVFASILPIHDYNKTKNPRYEISIGRPPAVIKQLNTFLREMCAKRGLVYLDYFTNMVDAQGFLKVELAEDGLHPNAAGYAAMAPLALGEIDRVLGMIAGH